MIEQIAIVSQGAKILHGTHRLLKKLGPDDNFLEAREELFRDWLVELVRNLEAFEERYSAHEREEYERRTADDEFLAVVANYFRAAHEEPLAERRRMLAFAAAAIANLSLTVGQLARVQRVLRELDPGDVLTLYELFLIPDHSAGKAHCARFRLKQGNVEAARLRLAYWTDSEAEALLASGCIRLTGGGVAGPFENAEGLDLSQTGRMVLRALRPYIAARSPDVAHVPGHEVSDEFCTPEEAKELIAALPDLRAVLRRVRKLGGRLQFDAANIADGAPHNQKTKLVFWLPEAEADCLGTVSLNEGQLEAQAQSTVVLGSVRPSDNGTVEVHVWGPHDALRILAYEFDAIWA